MLRCRVLCLLLLSTWIVVAPLRAAEPPLPGAAIATAHPFATDAGHEILAAGGNAFDAAVAVSAALAVVEPYSSGLGGGGFWLLHRARDGRQVMLDGRERAPRRATRDMYLDAHGEVIPNASVDGPFAAGIPGVPAALAHLARDYGRLPLAVSLAPATRYAREGFRVDAHYRRMAGFRLGVLRASPDAARIFLDHGEVPAEGYLIRQPELARTLEAIAARGAAGFYRGEIAQRLVTGSRDAGGIWSLEDLATYTVLERQPLAGDFRGYHIVSVAPPSSGGVAILEILNLLDSAPAPADEAGHSHLVVEAMRRAYRDRAEYLGDPAYVAVPVQRLISPAYAAGLMHDYHADAATLSAELAPVAADTGKGADTTHFSIIDREGNRVAATLSINYPFGSGFVAPGTGVLLNDEMDDFSAKPGVPNVYGLVGAEANAIAPGKRPLSSMSPTFVESERGVAVLGTPGGSRIISMVLLGILDYMRGADAQHIVSLSRFHHQYLPDVIQHEANALTDEVRAELALRGHLLSEKGDWGNMQVVLWQRAGNRLDAASDPRGNGEASIK